jgi:hypothetical protein
LYKQSLATTSVTCTGTLKDKQTIHKNTVVQKSCKQSRNIMQSTYSPELAAYYKHKKKSCKQSKNNMQSILVPDLASSGFTVRSISNKDAEAATTIRQKARTMGQTTGAHSAHSFSLGLPAHVHFGIGNPNPTEER